MFSDCYTSTEEYWAHPFLPAQVRGASEAQTISWAGNMDGERGPIGKRWALMAV